MQVTKFQKKIYKNIKILRKNTKEINFNLEAISDADLKNKGISNCNLIFQF